MADTHSMRSASACALAWRRRADIPALVTLHAMLRVTRPDTDGPRPWRLANGNVTFMGFPV